MHQAGLTVLQAVSPQTPQARARWIRTSSGLRRGRGALLRWAGVVLLAGYAGAGGAGSLAQGDAVGQADAAAQNDAAAQADATAQGAVAEAAAPAVAVQALWKEQEISFHFQSFTTFYSCNSLEDKIERILHALGARATVRVRDVACPFSVARMPRVLIQLRSPVEATPDALAEYEKGRTRRELVARVRGERAEESADMAQFPATWKSVTLSRGPLDLDSGDCELVRELRRKVFPKLAVRITKDDMRCSPGQPVLKGLRLQMEALVELPSPDAQGVEDRRAE